jgi:mono/diheme cytochrome c family protein
MMVMMGSWLKSSLTIIAIAGLVNGIWLSGAAAETDPVNAKQVAKGRSSYLENCASCHGVKLEGQPDWRSRKPDGKLPAPPHDASGHTWHHPDNILLRIIKEGTAAIVGQGYKSDMPGFKDLLSDEEILTALEFIKSDWPERQRKFQKRRSQQAREVEK